MVRGRESWEGISTLQRRTILRRIESERKVSVELILMTGAHRSRNT